MLKYYGVWEKQFAKDPRAMARAISHLEYIRKQEKEASLKAMGLIK